MDLHPYLTISTQHVTTTAGFKKLLTNHRGRRNSRPRLRSSSSSFPSSSSILQRCEDENDDKDEDKRWQRDKLYHQGCAATRSVGFGVN
jgi:hypothetical protein